MDGNGGNDDAAQGYCYLGRVRGGEAQAGGKNAKKRARRTLAAEFRLVEAIDAVACAQKEIVIRPAVSSFRRKRRQGSRAVWRSGGRFSPQSVARQAVQTPQAVHRFRLSPLVILQRVRGAKSWMDVRRDTTAGNSEA